MVNHKGTPSRKIPVPQASVLRDQAHAVHAARMTQLATLAGEMGDNFRIIANACREAHMKGEKLAIQNQINFLTGGMARLLKDWGHIEGLQSMNIVTQVQPPAE